MWGDKAEEKELENIDIEKNPLGALMKMGKKMEEKAKKMEEKAKNKDNAKALHYEELIKYLPSSIEGYSIFREPEGETMDMQGVSYSSAEVVFKNENNDRLSISILDYNAAYGMYSMATTMWSAGFKIDTSDEIAQSVSLGDDINGWESFKKKSGTASVILGINDRFLITVEARNQENISFVKKVAQSIDLEKLSSLD